jgi:ATP-binding cassette subfamily B protein
MKEYIDKLNLDAKIEKTKRNRILYTANSFIFAFITLIYSMCLILGAYFIAKGIYTYGALIAIVQLINNIEAPFINLSGLINHYNLGKTSKERYLKLINEENINNSCEINDFDSIVFDNLSFKYDDRYIIKDFNLEIKKGDILKIGGESGIGKTTLLSLILGYLEPNSGDIRFVKDNKKYDTYKSRGLFGYLSQDNILFSATILDNIYILTGIKDINKINDALKLANIYDEIYQMKDGINTKLSNNQGLSLGQIQRILIAILILYDKPILLLDEFSSSLDKDNENIIINNLLSLNKTIIYITHRNNIISNQRVIEIKNENN